MKTIIMILVSTMILSMGWTAPSQAERLPSLAGNDKAATMGEPILPSSVPEITVNHFGDAPDATGGTGVCETAPGNGQCTLRAAIQTAEVYYGDNPVKIDVIVSSIMPNSALPDIKHNNLTIMGNSVFLSGLLAGADASGFTIHWSANENVRIQGFTINGFNKHGIHIMGDNHIIGVDGDGVNDENEGNVIYSNGEYGVYIDTGNYNRISGNYIGTLNGTTAAPNKYGIVIQGAIENLIGTNGDGISDVLERNIISGNTLDGVWITNSRDNTIAGNYIGTSADGTSAIGNRHGVDLHIAQYNIIGTNGDGTGDSDEGNLISGNNENGVYIRGSSTKENRVAGNFIGTNANGTSALPNYYGVEIRYEASKNIIGTNGDGISDDIEGNLISGNIKSGVSIYGLGTDENWVAGNVIGLNIHGNSAIPNEEHGIDLRLTQNNIVGSNFDYQSDNLERNIISGNAKWGIWIHGKSTYKNKIQGNYIGLSKSGLVARGNQAGGIFLENTKETEIGCPATACRNVIAGNENFQIRIDNSSENTIRGNFIGTDKTGLKAISTPTVGITIHGSSPNNTIGGSSAGARNTISGNGKSGIQITGNLTKNTKIIGNYIGVGADGNTPLGNLAGIYFIDYSVDITIGGVTAGSANIIAHNTHSGIYVRGDRIAIRGNNIFNNGLLGIKHHSVADNNGQVYPVLSGASIQQSGNLLIEGSLTSTANINFDLDFFVSEACDPSGYGQGQQYIGSKALSGTPSGLINFTHTIPDSFTPGHVITSTATDADGNTSEFSACIVIRTAAEPGTPVKAEFTATPTSGQPPLLVNFTNMSTGDYSSCAWDFGDGATSTNCNNPSHTYQSVGVYTVKLTVSGGGGTDPETKNNYIYVGTPVPKPGAFSKTNPANGATNQPTNPTLSWGSSSNASSYEYCYDTTNDNACSNWVSNGSATSKTLSGLKTNTTYYWHVRAKNSTGTTYANGSITAFWSFTTKLAENDGHYIFLPLILK